MSSKLTFSEFIPARDGQAWRYYLRDTIRYLPCVAKAKYQRATRGWADCDTWSIDAWFQSIVPDMLRHLADHNHGVPSVFVEKDTEVEEGALVWEKLLRKMAFDLEAHRRFWGEDFDLYKGLPIKEFSELDRKSIAQVEEGLEVFKKYFFNLWD